MNTEQLIEIVSETAIQLVNEFGVDHYGFDAHALGEFANRIEQPHIDTIEDLHDEIGRLRAEIADLKLKLEASDAAFMAVRKELLLLGGGK